MRSEILSRLRDGQRMADIARELKLPYSVVQQVAGSSRIKYVGKRLTDKQKEIIRRLREEQDCSIRIIAKKMKLPKSKIGRAVKANFDREVSDGGTEVAPQQMPKPKRCPVHGLVTLWPCVACAATAKPQG